MVRTTSNSLLRGSGVSEIDPHTEETEGSARASDIPGANMCEGGMNRGGGRREWCIGRERGCETLQRVTT
jgi:hypothetical protein